MKMKQIAAFILSLVLCLSFSACGIKEGQLVENEIQTSGQTKKAEENSDSEQQRVSEEPKFDLEKGTVMLSSGYEMPILGIGTFRLSGSEAENSVYWALRDGYRLMDTARIYGNEADVGCSIQKAIDEGFVTREEIFVTTKM